MIAAVVLAAGSSARFGRPKALLPCAGRTFLETILTTLSRTRVDAVRVVLGDDADRIVERVPLQQEQRVINPRPQDGMLSSVIRGIDGLPSASEAFLLWPVDHPLVRADTVDALVEAWARRRPAVIVPLHEGRRGHPVLLDAALIPELRRAPPSEGARHVVHAHADSRLQIAVEDLGVVTDIDTPERYVQAFGHPPPTQG